ncbi:hypothetical protein ACWE42_22400 [Sutcliffiella cohnii]
MVERASLLSIPFRKSITARIPFSISEGPISRGQLGLIHLLKERTGPIG